jgi:mannose-6-phosphate isomerase
MIDFAADERRLAAGFVSYVFRDMAALWATHGWDAANRRGRERLRADLRDADLGYRRSMVVGRQLFFFAHAFSITRDAVFRDRAYDLLVDLEQHFWDSEHGGWFFSVADPSGPANTTKDLYAHAFVLFGLAHHVAIFGDADAARRLRETNALVNNRFALPKPWFAQSTTQAWGVLNRNLEQNPHMHLLEAYLSAHRVMPDDGFLDDASRIIGLFAERLLTPDGSKVLEHFDEEGRPSSKGGELIEPGHLYEWYWLLNEYAEIADRPEYARLADPVIEWVEARGRDARGGIYDLVDMRGRPVSERKRIWPVTEAIKAWATRARTRQDAASRAALLAWIGFISDRYFTGKGGWYEYLNPALQPDSDFLPASTPYHVAMAALEVERLLGGPGAFGLGAER